MSNADQAIRIATWNLERPTQNGWAKNQRRLDKINDVNADLWVLTETNSAISLESNGYTAVESCPIQGYHKAGEHLSTIWSAWKVMDYIPTFDASFAVCAEIESPFGPMIVYGTVITYANDRGPNGTAKRWEEHRRSIQHHHEDWLRIKHAYPNHLMCVAGDFNQSRDGSGWYEDKDSVELLTQALQDLGLSCVTEENMMDRGLSRASVDHVCLSDTLKPNVVTVTAWEGTTAIGEKMSDHNGIVVELSNNC